MPMAAKSARLNAGAGNRLRDDARLRGPDFRGVVLDPAGLADKFA